MLSKSLDSQWSFSEILLLEEKIKVFKYRKWHRIQEAFESQNFFRSQNELKQRWRHIKTSNNDCRVWEKQELRNLYESTFEYGSQWNEIRKKMMGRSSIKVKNTFYGAIKCFLKEVLHSEFSNIKEELKPFSMTPSTCLNIFRGQNKFESLGSTVLEIFEELDFQISSQSIKHYIKQSPQKLMSLSEKIYQVLNHSKESQNNETSYNPTDRQQDSIEFVTQVICLSKKMENINEFQKIEQSQPLRKTRPLRCGYKAVTAQLENEELESIEGQC